MAGHSQFKNIMYRKGAQDAKRAKTFAKIGREIFVSVKLGGSDPSSNPRLRAALLSARSVNMPNDNINRIFKKAAGSDNNESYETVRYEGFGSGGVAVIIEALTDNRNRTSSEIRSTFSKYGGNLGDQGSVSFMFDRIGVINIDNKTTNFEHIFNTAAEIGADNVEEFEETFEVTCQVDKFGEVRDNLIKIFGEVLKSEIIWKPKNEIDCNLETTKTLIKMIDVLEDNEDIQQVFSNFSCTEEVQKLLENES